MLDTKPVSVEKGYVQKDGVNYDKKFAPVISFDVLLFITRQFTSVDCHAHHADISTACLKGVNDSALGKQVLQSTEDCVWFEAVPVPLA